MTNLPTIVFLFRNRAADAGGGGGPPRHPAGSVRDEDGHREGAPEAVPRQGEEEEEEEYLDYIARTHVQVCGKS